MTNAAWVLLCWRSKNRWHDSTLFVRPVACHQEVGDFMDVLSKEQRHKAMKGQQSGVLGEENRKKYGT